jgi:hypothetical protein
VGKSYLAYNMAIATACGIPILGRQVAPGKVLYVDEENSPADMRSYLYWAWGALGRPSIDTLCENLHILHFQLSCDPLGWSQRIYTACYTFQPTFIIIDTVTPACHIKDENDNGEAAIAAQKLRQAQHTSPGSTMLLLKHLRQTPDGHTDVRGAKYWKGTVDAILYHKKSRGKPRADGLCKTIIEPEKARAYGLRHSIEINPERISEGISLTATDMPLKD